MHMHIYKGRTCIAADAAASSSAVPGQSGMIQERLKDGINPAEWVHRVNP